MNAEVEHTRVDLSKTQTKNQTSALRIILEHKHQKFSLAIKLNLIRSSHLKIKHVTGLFFALLIDTTSYP